MMVHVGLPDSLAIYLFLVITVMMVGWWLAVRKSCVGSNRFKATEYVRQCPYCGDVFIDYRKMALMVCPLCKSYFEVSADGRAS